MNSFLFKMSSIVLTLLTLFRLMSALNICEQNEGNIEMKGGFIWKDSLYFVSKKDDRNYRVNGFKWIDDKFTIGSVEDIGARVWTSTGFNFMFQVDYPGIGPGYVIVTWTDDNPGSHFTAFLVSISGDFIEKEEGQFNLDPTKCHVQSDWLRLCDIIAKFPEEQKKVKNMLSLSFFPPSIDGLPPRLFVYYKETPPKKTSCEGNCYITKRFIFIGQNISYGEDSPQFNWLNDVASPAKCLDLEGRTVNLSTALTGYKKDGDVYNFDQLEISGTEFRVYRVSLTDESVQDNFKLIKSGFIGSMFGCKQSSTPATDKPKSTDNPEDGRTAPSDHTVGDSQSAPPDHTVGDSQLTTQSDKHEANPSKTTVIVIVIILILALVIFALGLAFWCYSKDTVRNQAAHDPELSKSKSNSDVTKRSKSPSNRSSESIPLI